jgi:hypothetical protein
MLPTREEFHTEYLKVMDPFDKLQCYEKYEPCLWVKCRLAHYVAPDVIVEIGVRSGYCAWAMLVGMPQAKYIGYDNYLPSYDEGLKLGKLSERFYAWAKKIIPPNGQIVLADSQAPGFKPAVAGLYHVDGDHTYASALHDIRTCMAAGYPSPVIAVHDFMAGPVRQAVLDAVKGTDFVCHEIVETRNGDAVLFKRSVPAWAESLRWEL